MTISQVDTGPSVFVAPDAVLVYVKYLMRVVNPSLCPMPDSWYNLSLAVEQAGNTTVNQKL